jgi:hypothetical protein
MFNPNQLGGEAGVEIQFALNAAGSPSGSSGASGTGHTGPDQGRPLSGHGGRLRRPGAGWPASG